MSPPFTPVFGIPGEWTKGALIEHVKTGMQVELGTLPIYFCALYSIKLKRDNGQWGSKARANILAVAEQEMLHLALAGNMLHPLRQDRHGAATRRHTGLADGDNDTRTLIEAAANGWWYSARLPHRKRLVVYTTSPSNPTARVARSAAGFLDLLHSDTVHISRSICGNPHQDAHSADSSATTPVPLYEPPPGTKFTRCTTAASSVLEPYASWEPQHESELEAGEGRRGRGWCAVGDAALAFDPLSSQGIITALNAGMFLGSVLAGHLRPTPADDGSHLEGGDVVDEIQRAYEDVREKYEDGRAYYYGIVKRFEVPGEENEENGRGFWERQR